MLSSGWVVALPSGPDLLPNQYPCNWIQMSVSRGNRTEPPGIPLYAIVTSRRKQRKAWFWAKLCTHVLQNSITAKSAVFCIYTVQYIGLEVSLYNYKVHPLIFFKRALIGSKARYVFIISVLRPASQSFSRKEFNCVLRLLEKQVSLVLEARS